ncbi:hypothetical protein [Phenylobacterium sp.]|uniref:hypothetical protein n=1 Tax=Phenylobacterium sp. TaxID=1871053 RepID=UPI002F940F8F
MRFIEKAQEKTREAERAIRQRMREVSHDARELEALGHQVVKRAIRAGQEVVAKTPTQVRQLGLAAVEGRLPQALSGAAPKKAAPLASPTKRSTSTAQQPAKPRPGKNVVREQVRAGISGAVDEFTLGAADHVLSAGEAVLGGGVQGFRDRYAAEMRQRRADDAYDSQHYGAARTAGRAVGLVGGLAATGGAATVGARALAGLPQTAKVMAAVAKAPKLRMGVDPRGLPQLAAGGGAVGGVGAQVVEDSVSGRLSSPGQYAASALGGATGGVATLRYGPMHGGAIGGASEAAASDLAAGRLPSADRAIGSAHGAAMLGKVGDVVGTYRTATLPAHLKGKVGEALSYGKTLARGKVPNVKPGRVKVGNSKYSIPDQQIGDDFLEAKMGPSADLTKNQRLHRAKLNREGKELIIDAWQFRDVGRAAGIVGAPLGGIWENEEARLWPGR